MRAHGMLIAVALVIVSCGGSGGPVHVELAGKPPAEAGKLAAQAVCGRDARCGKPSVTCSFSGPAGDGGASGPATMTCEGRITPVSYDDCFEDASSDVSELLASCQLSGDELDTLELCFDTLASRACVTQAEVEAMARVRETGGEPAREERPAACAVLVTPPASCTGRPPTRQ